MARLPDRAHRWIGIVMVVPFLAWTATGLLFQLKPGWGRAYDLLSERAAGALPADGLVPPAAAIQASGAGEVSRVELFASAIGPLYRLDRAGQESLVDARTGRLLSPLAPEPARAIVEDAVARSTYRASYGAPVEVGVADTEVVVTFSSGARVTLDRASARLAQRGGDTDRIDWLYRVHYLRWTGVPSIDRPLSVAAIAGTWLLAGLGVVLFVRRRHSTFSPSK